jgi:large repetitive protein
MENPMRLAKLSCLTLMLCLLSASAASAQERDFALRHSSTDNGDILLIGNTVLNCDPALTVDCLAARSFMAVTAQNNNNAHNMAMVDVDGDSSTFNSSQVTLTLPAGGEILWAGLYWGANTTAGTSGVAAPSAADKNKVRLLAPGSAGYVNVVASGCDSRDEDYQCFAEVTGLLGSQTSGAVTVGNVQAGTGKNRYGGWSLVLVVRDPSAPTRNLVVFDGYRYVRDAVGFDIIDIPVSGFLTPPGGPVRTRLGVVGYEGDSNATGDSLRLNGQAVSNMLNPTSNIFNSTATDLNVAVTARVPADPNLFGFDVDRIEANGILPNSATSATITLRTGGETYFPGVVTFATEIYAPGIVAAKLATDRNGGDLEAGDVLEYSFTLPNNGFDGAGGVEIVDALPQGVTYVPGSMTVGGAACTDAADADRCAWDNATRTARIGVGDIASMASATATLRVTVNAGALSGGQIANQAEVRYQAVTLNRALVTFTGDASNPSLKQPTISIIDTRPPTVLITTPTEGMRVGAGAVTSAGSAEPAATLTITLDGQPVGNPQVIGMTGQWTQVLPANLSEGAHVLTAQAVDRAGNSATTQRTFNVDLTPPTVAIAQPSAMATLNTATPVISGSAEPGAQVTVLIDGMQVGQVTANAQGMWTVTPATPLLMGMHTVVARARDEAGNQAEASAMFSVDLAAPTLTIDSPPNGASLRDAMVRVVGKADAGATVRVALDGAMFTSVVADGQGAWTFVPTQALGEGSHIAIATTRNAAGISAQAESRFTVDTAAPQVTIITPAQDAVLNTTMPAITGGAEARSTLVLSLDGAQVATIQVGNDGGWAFAPTMALAEGTHQAIAIATDAAGNTAQAERTFRIRLGAPAQLMIASPTDGARLNSSWDKMIRGTGTPDQTLQLSIDQRPTVDVLVDAQGQWTHMPTPPLEDGAHDAAAQLGEASDMVSFTLDTVGPQVGITTPVNNGVISADTVIRGTGEPGAMVEVFLDGDRIGTATVGADGTWSLTPEQPLPTSGSHTIAARGQDDVGNITQVTVAVTTLDDSLIMTGAGCAHVPTDAPRGGWAGLLLLALLGAARRVPARRRAKRMA